MSGKSRIGRCTTQAIGAALALLATLVLVSCTPSTDAVSSATLSPETYSTPYYGQVNVREVIIRQSPDIGSPEVARLPQGTGVSVLARQGDWVQVETPSATGWVLAELLAITQSPPVPSPVVISVRPDSASTDQGSVTVTIVGENLRETPDVFLIGGTQGDIPATGVRVYAAGSRVLCSFDITDAEPGMWGVLVSNPDGTWSELLDAFTITAPPTPTPTLTLLPPATPLQTPTLLPPPPPPSPPPPTPGPPPPTPAGRSTKPPPPTPP